jgi:hypothetical protein
MHEARVYRIGGQQGGSPFFGGSMISGLFQSEKAM